MAENRALERREEQARNSRSATAGRYRLRDYVRMGIPLDLTLALIALWLIPRSWPLVAR